MLALLDDGEAYVRRYAAEALRTLKPEAALIALLRDAEMDVSTATVYALGGAQAGGG